MVTFDNTLLAYHDLPWPPNVQCHCFPSFKMAANKCYVVSSAGSKRKSDISERRLGQSSSEKKKKKQSFVHCIQEHIQEQEISDISLLFTHFTNPHVFCILGSA